METFIPSYSTQVVLVSSFQCKEGKKKLMNHVIVFHISQSLLKIVGLFSNVSTPT